MYFLTLSTATDILHLIEAERTEAEISLDLGISKTSVELGPEGMRIGSVTADVKSLGTIAQDNKNIYFVMEQGIFKTAIFEGGHLYRLFPTAGAPALVIDSFMMNPREDPMRDAKAKAKYVRANDRVLDICTGLGYTALSCLRKRAKEVVTIEKDENVIALAKINPYSEQLFKDKRISLVRGDAFEVIEKIPGRFNRIIHDPPVPAMGGELYSTEFYRKLFEKCAPHARLYHYIPKTGSKYRRKDMFKGVMDRLRAAGFQEVKRVSNGVFCAF